MNTPLPQQPASSTPPATNKSESSLLSKIITIGVIILVVVLIYNFVTNHGLKGTWISDDDSSFSITFSDRKTGYFTYGRETAQFTYTVDGKELTIITKETFNNESEVIKLKFKAKRKTLTLTYKDGTVSTFHKQ